MRLAAAGEAAELLALTSRRGVPAAGGLFAVAVDMAVLFLCLQGVETSPGEVDVVHVGELTPSAQL